MRDEVRMDIGWIGTGFGCCRKFLAVKIPSSALAFAFLHYTYPALSMGSACIDRGLRRAGISDPSITSGDKRRIDCPFSNFLSIPFSKSVLSDD